MQQGKKKVYLRGIDVDHDNTSNTRNDLQDLCILHNMLRSDIMGQGRVDAHASQMRDQIIQVLWQIRMLVFSLGSEQDQ